jgi:hypothetical protein
MITWIKAIFQANSDVSSMRVMSMVSLLTASYIGIAGLYEGKNLAELSILCGAFLSGAFGAKYMQKTLEVKKNGDT